MHANKSAISYKNLCAFVSVANARTFAQAAENLCLSQPAFSTSIKNMEAQLGGALFTRSTRKVALTPEGKAFLPQAMRLIEDWENALGDVRDLFSVQKGRLTVASMPSFAEGHLADILQAFHKTYPNIMLRVSDVVMEQAIAQVKTNRAELAFVFEPESLQGLFAKSLLTDTFCVVMSADHDLATRAEKGANSLRLEDTVAYEMVAMNVGSGIRQWVDSAFQALSQDTGDDIKASIVAEASQLGTLGQLVKAGLGIALVPGLCQGQMEAKGLLCIPLDCASLNKQVVVLKSAETELSSAAQSLWNMLEPLGLR